MKKLLTFALFILTALIFQQCAEDEEKCKICRVYQYDSNNVQISVNQETETEVCDDAYIELESQAADTSPFDNSYTKWVCTDF